MAKIKVYIASPYSLGDVAVNVRDQIITANTLMTLGYVPFVPLLSHFRHMMFPRNYVEWLNYAMEWIPVCDCMLRLPGKSKGADEEVALAVKLNIPVFHLIHEIVDYY